MADQTSIDTLLKALGWTGAGSVGIIATAIWNGIRKGSAGLSEQQRDVRDGLVAQVAAQAKLIETLQNGQETLQTRFDALELRLNRATSRYWAVRHQRDSAWNLLDAYKTRCGDPVTSWPTDPPEDF